VKRPLPLAARLTLSFILVAALFSATLAVVLELIIDRQFLGYIEEVREKKHGEIVRYFEQIYAKDRSWSADSGTEIAEQAMMDGSVVALLDGDGKVLWSMDREMVELHYRMMGHEGSEYGEREYPVLFSGTRVGSVRVGNFTGAHLSPEDAAFRRSLRRGVPAASAVGVLAAVVLSLFLSRRLSRPLRRTTDLAERLRRGELSVRIRERFGTNELDSLADALNFLAQSLEEQEKLRRQLTRDVSHELRTPLNALNALVEACLDGVMEPTPERLEDCREEIARLVTLTRDLERLSDLEGDVLTLSAERLDLAEAARSAARSFEPLCLRKGVSLEVRAEEGIFVSADGDKLRQTLVNLLANAVEYTPPGGSITVRAFRDGDRTRLAVSDTGIGMAPEELPRIFERFYRVDRSRSRSSGGSGIGLAIVDRIAAAHGWKILAESEPGRGSVFTVEFPDR
jgi:signal transduction histidine kinase